MKFKHLAVMMIMLGVIGGAVFVSSSTAYATGGAAGSGGSGSGGSGGGSGCSSGHWLVCGYGWVEYPANENGGPSDGFRNGGTNAYWNSIVRQCGTYNASTITVFIIREGDGSAMGYDYQSSYDGDPTRIPVKGPSGNRNKVDTGNRATVISDNEAREDYGRFLTAIREGGGSAAGLSWGSNISWICANFDSVPDWTLEGESTVNGGSSVTASPGDNVTFRHYVKNLGPDDAWYGWKAQSSTNPNNQNSWANNGLNSGSVDGSGKGNKAPNYSANYKIPDSAPNGAVYCQRIEFSNKNGPRTTPFPDEAAHSDRACVTVKKVEDPPGYCKSFTARNEGTITFASSGSTHNQQVYVWSDGVNLGGAGDKEIGTFVGDNNGAGSGGKAESQTFNYHANKKEIVIKVKKQYWAQNATPKQWKPVPGWGDANGVKEFRYTCYQATCRVAVLGDPTLGGTNRVKAGSQYQVMVEISNPSLPSGNYPLTPTRNADGIYAGEGQGYSLSATEYPSGTPHPFGTTVPPGESRWSAPITLTAPNEVTTASPVFYPDYFYHPGLGALGGGCTAPVEVYKQVGATPIASTTLNNGGFSAENTESPNNFQHTSWLDVNNAPSTGANLSYTTCAYKTTTSAAPMWYCPTNAYPGTKKTQGSPTIRFKNGAPSLADTNNYTLTGGEAIGSAAGDKYCTYISTNSAGGFVGPSGEVVGGSFAQDLKCTPIVNKPYFKTYGKGIRAGGDFTGSCDQGGLLASWNDNTNSAADRGAGSQLSALAMIKITGVASAQAKATNPSTSQTFANNMSSSPSNSSSPELGGEFGGSFCFDDVASPAASGSVGSPVIGVSGSQKFTGGDKAIAGGSVNAVNQSIFVEGGNVYINNNITFGSWSDSSNIPSFVLRTSGNIYISSDVTQLDGLYIAGGKIYTCSEPGRSSGATQKRGNAIYTGCSKQLKVNGAFIAKQINLMRTYGSLRDSNKSANNANAPESPNNTRIYESPNDLLGCSNTGATVIGGNVNFVCAAEYFNFSPEMYLAKPALQTPNGGTRNYDSIVSLPPVL